MKLFNAFLKDESGAVTVDWVVLTAAIVGLGIAVLTSVQGGTSTLANKISSSLANAQIQTLDCLAADGNCGGSTSGGTAPASGS
jgi:Flp pilus assembly pilin Flp